MNQFTGAVGGKEYVGVGPHDPVALGFGHKPVNDFGLARPRFHADPVHASVPGGVFGEDCVRLVRAEVGSDPHFKLAGVVLAEQTVELGCEHGLFVVGGKHHGH